VGRRHWLAGLHGTCAGGHELVLKPLDGTSRKLSRVRPRFLRPSDNIIAAANRRGEADSCAPLTMKKKWNTGWNTALFNADHNR
jgi:hypothetical protein